MAMPVNVALLGAGIFALNEHLPAIFASPSAKLHSVWSRSEASAKKLSAASGGVPVVYFGEDQIDPLLADPEVQAVIIVLPIEKQPGCIRKAWAAGKHVLSEKPMSMDVAEAKQLIKEYETFYEPKGLIWRVAENFAHEPMLHKTRTLLADPNSGLGSILYYQTSFIDFVPDGHRYQSTSWRTIPAYQGGFLYDGGVHYAALMRTILPIPPASVVAATACHRAHLPPNDHLMALCIGPPESAVEPHGPPTALTTAQHDVSVLKGVGKSITHGTFTLSLAPPNTTHSATPYGVVVTCVNGIVSVLQSSAGWTLRVEPHKGSDVKSLEFTGPVQGVQVEVDMFVRAIQGERGPNYGNPRDTLWDVAFIQACLDSGGNQIILSSLTSMA
ncbi:hypothetical protein EHS25_000903 [Saitozyma podzolica]|uniref:Gfo/Idh/MocA-like oxidoreductase N-terminal domain-containing protein n=1 Tax=Saitozyma podzolica TaxID=1890683 RepID=A0A427YXK9_9TREE|nr:hypothetical protein EHS25_000903 [Saitozyma podzolica]